MVVVTVLEEIQGIMHDNLIVLVFLMEQQQQIVKEIVFLNPLLVVG